MAEKRGLIDKNYHCFADDIIDKFQFKYVCDYPPNKLLKAMKMDKKADFDKINFILPVNYSTVEEFKLSDDEIFV